MSTRAGSPAGRWDRFWFADTPLARLGAFRILICGLAFFDAVQYGRAALRDAAAVSAGDVARPWQPIYLFDVLGVQPLGLDAAQWAVAATLIALGLATVGLCARVTCLLGFLGYLLLTGLVYSFGKPHHDKIALTFALLALPWAPVGARLSLDSLIARWRRAGRGEDPRVVPHGSTWAAFPLRLTQVSIAIGYAFAGWSKIWIGGAEWFNGYTLQGIMMGHDNAWSAMFAQNVLWNRVSSVGLVLTQAAFPAVFFAPRLLWFFVPMATTFHLLSWATMDTGPYITLWFTMCAFLPLERVPAWVRAHLRGWRAPLVAALVLAPAVLIWNILASNLPVWALLVMFGLPAIAFALYTLPCLSVEIACDGSTRCRRALAVLLALDWGQLLRVRDGASSARGLRVITAGGTTLQGAEALFALGWRLPPLVVLAPLLGVVRLGAPKPGAS
jgi:hypothetical protein